MQSTTELESFRLSTGGLFYQFNTMLHIQSPDGYSIKRRLALLTTISWLPLLLLATIEGNLFNSSLDLPFIYDLKPYVRYLLVLPLLIVADTIIDPLIAMNIRSVGSSGILGEDNQDRYQAAVDRLESRKDSKIADIIILLIISATLLTYLSNLDDLDMFTDFTSWMMAPGTTEPMLTASGWWFFAVSSPILQILIYRWFWRFYLWAAFLYQISRIKLKLQPTHPDLAGGLGILKNGESAFILIFIAFGAMFSVSLAEEILYTDITLADARPLIFGYIVAVLFIMTLPLMFFTKHLIKAKRWGRVAYGGLGYRLSRAFDKKWANPEDQSNGDELLKTADASAVCDYSDIYDVVRNMRFLPISIKGYALQASMLAIPFIPLVFTEVPIADVITRLMDAMM
jgi:hypothetical protein